MVILKVECEGGMDQGGSNGNKQGQMDLKYYLVVEK